MELILMAGVIAAACLLMPLFAASANVQLGHYPDQETRVYPVGAGVHIYLGTNVGRDPAGYLKPFVPGDEFVGIAYAECDNSSGAAGAKTCQVFTQGDFKLPITSVALTDRNKPVFCTADNTYALAGHPDAYFGRVMHYEASGYAVVRMKAPGEKAPNGYGSMEQVITGAESFAPTGAASSSTYHPSGFVAKSILGLGLYHRNADGGGVAFEFDATAEVALASLRSINANYPVAGGITLEGLIVLADKGDAAAIDLDFGLGTALTTNSEADVDHADMVNLAAFHLDGASDNINCQSDNNVTDVAPVDSTIDNDSATDVPKRFKIIVRPDGSVEFWIDNARVLPTTAFAVSSAAVLAPFVNLEKTSDDTTALAVVARLRVAGSKAA